MQEYRETAQAQASLQDGTMAAALRDDAIIGRDASLTDAARVSQPGFSGSRTKPVMATKGHRQLSRREQASQDRSIEVTFGSDGAKNKKIKKK